MNKMVLIVEDDVELREALAFMLRSKGVRCVEAGSAAAAVIDIACGGIDAVLSDVGLDSASGLDLLRSVREFNPDVPFFLMSGSDSVDLASLSEFALSGFFLKPFKLEQIITEISAALGDASERKN